MILSQTEFDFLADHFDDAPRYACLVECHVPSPYGIPMLIVAFRSKIFSTVIGVVDLAPFAGVLATNTVL